jgi:hypothetical protein
MQHVQSIVPVPELKVVYLVSEEYECPALSTHLQVNIEVQVYLHFTAEPTYTSWKINDFESMFIFKLGRWICFFG